MDATGALGEAVFFLSIFKMFQTRVNLRRSARTRPPTAIMVGSKPVRSR